MGMKFCGLNLGWTCSSTLEYVDFHFYGKKSSFKYFVGIFNSWIAQPTKYTELNV